ncbi:hypothetical protein [Demequina globuliformis]|uniref:hypothetical protein n=1 Tax=Demequina globuliformis TaxID=676202 RepID=UPI000780810A|nr:hypothetical protein [Demequina globuliformis]
MTVRHPERDYCTALNLHRDEGVFRVRSIAGGDMYVDLRDLEHPQVAFMPQRTRDGQDWHGWWWPLMWVTSAPATHTVLGHPIAMAERTFGDLKVGRVRLYSPTVWVMSRGQTQRLGLATCAEIIQLTADTATGEVAEVAWIQKGEV